MIRATLSALVPHEERNAPRRLINFGARLRAGAGSIKIVVSNMSATGFLATGAGQLQAGEDLWIRLPGIEARRCQVVRHSEGDTAFEFFAPLRESDLDQLRPPRNQNTRRSDFGQRDPAGEPPA